LIKFLKKQIRK